jgi:D-glycero-alpha-D-manno-heptose-7-phosphate kinase
MIIESVASNRICDFGGWTDTWFAKNGAVLNFAVDLYARVTIRTRSEPGITIHAQDYEDRIHIDDITNADYSSKHALLIAALKIMKIRQGLDVFISADVPAGCGTGSSAAISVAMIKGLSLLNGECLVAHEVGKFAHKIETEELDIQSGIQDQISSAYGGVNYIEMYEYPNAFVSPVNPPPDVFDQLENRWVLVYEGERHLSGDVHEKVISELDIEGSRAHKGLAALKETATIAKRALMRGEIGDFCEAMNVNNKAQKQLHLEIDTDNFRKIEDIGKNHGVLGSMINGAGGGGSIILVTEPGHRTELEHALARENFRMLPCRISFDPARAWVADAGRS